MPIPRDFRMPPTPSKHLGFAHRLVAIRRYVLGAVRHPLRFLKYLRHFLTFRRLSRSTTCDLPIRWRDQYPCLSDETSTTPFDRHYVYHTAWAARVLAREMPSMHVDISSSLYFVTNLSAFIPVHFYDFRPADIALSNLTSDRADVCNLPFPDASVRSLSCMHVVEHIGLGRYGDPLEPLGDRKAMRELQRVLAADGLLLFVVPIGAPRICFNAHRIYAYEDILNEFSELTLVEFALIRDDAEGGGLLNNPPGEIMARQDYGCGCFLFTRCSN